MRGAAVQVRQPVFMRPANDNPEPWYRPLLRVGVWALAATVAVLLVLLARQ